MEMYIVETLMTSINRRDHQQQIIITDCIIGHRGEMNRFQLINKLN